MISKVEFELTRLNATLRQIHPVMKRSREKLVTDAARLATRRAIEMTPPGDSRVSGQAARKRGENAIKRDATGGRRGADGGTKRSGIFFTANEGLLRKWANQHPGGQVERLFVKKDGTVWATEKRFYKPGASIADMNAHHRQYFKNGKMTSAGSRDRNIGRWRFVDRLVVGKGALNAWLRHKYARVGFYAAGWMPAVEKLKVSKVPAWIRRHGSKGKGRCQFISRPDGLIIEIANSTGFGDLSRIVPYALAAARRGMEAQAKVLIKKDLQQAGFKNAA